MIHSSEVFRSIDSLDEYGEPTKFSCTVITADLGRDTGGEKMYLHDARLYKNSKAAQKKRAKKQKDSLSIRPNERKNITRNVLLKNGEVIKIHPHLIIRFNGNEVLP